MARTRIAYVCSECGAATPKWQGQCPACGVWNALQAAAQNDSPARRMPPAEAARRLDALGPVPNQRVSTGMNELDRVLGGGLVRGSVVLVGGAPGIGKSTLLLQAAGAAQLSALYVSGEESADQIGLRASRLGVKPDNVAVLATTSVDELTDMARSIAPSLVIVDSIQTMYAESVPSPAGSPNQLRECAARLINLAKTQGTVVVMVGHVTKEGVIAGPRMLEHMVDVVLYFEDEVGSRFRLLRAIKNRFGAASELGVFAMSEHGLKEVRNPSAIFLSRRDEDVCGSVVTVLNQGTRPLLVEVQALTDRGGGGAPRRLAIGIDQNRLALLLAVLHRHAGIRSHDDDVFVNVVGGVRVAETAADLAVLAAVASSSRSRPVCRTLVMFGEVGLGGEIRPVAYGEERIREAAKLGFRQALVPNANVPKRAPEGMRVSGVDALGEALRILGCGA